MMTIFWAWAVAASAQPLPEPVAPSPVQEWAVKDLRGERVGRIGLVVAATGGGLLLVGGGLITEAQQVNADEGQRALNDALVVGGVAASVVGPSLLLAGSWRSSSALRRQALPVRSTLAAAGLGLYGTAVVYTVVRSQDLQSADLPVIAGLYLGSVALGAAQVRRNHVARRDAGWLGVVPRADPRAPGLQLVGTF